MRIESSKQLTDVLQQLELLAAEQLAQLPRLALERPDAPDLAKLLVQRGWLTVFQMNQLLTGLGKSLVIGAYHVLDRLGQGGLSQVFKARHSRHGWSVALKVLRREALASDEGRQQFLHEMEAMARLNHPNVVQFCDVDQAGDIFFYAMEFVNGTDLGKYVRLSGPLPVAEACDFVRQTALGLQHAHEHNLVHRDIKPVNLYLTHAEGQNQPVVKILDWGLASLRFPTNVAGQQLLEHMSKGVVGTADFLSPEQGRNAQTVDIRGDIYSLGCTFYYLLTGEPPFPEGTLMQKILQHQTMAPPPIDTFREDVPSGVTAVLKRMLAKQPEDRFQTPAAVALALAPFARDGRKSGSRKRAYKRGRLPSRRDDTPLPVSLGGKPGKTMSRLPKAGPQRSPHHGPDTSCPYVS
ncbi:MAG: serine/threonine protein kinase [Gemmataceae bacterium]|nr:serine/threonine protein kinase [Gemmataceae bacterium]